MRYLSALLVLAIGCIVFAGCGSTQNVATGSLIANLAGGGVYIAIGDSIAAGEGASDPEATGYVALVLEAIGDASGDAPDLQDVSVGGHTTQDLIDTQLAPALDQISAGEVRLVTLTIGGNDLFKYAADPDCVRDPVEPGCPLQAGLLDVERNLDRILGELREAGPDTVIVISLYPQLFSGSGHPFERQAEAAFDLLNGVIVSVAGRHDVLVADPRPDFQGLSRDLTHIDDEPVDFHPNDAGYRVIADAFLDVLGLSASGDATSR